MEDNKQIPEIYICPIGGNLMKDPVLTMGGNCYDRDAIQRWFGSGKNTDPLTGAPLSSTDLIPNHQLRSAIIKLNETDISKLESQINQNKMNKKDTERLDFLRKKREQQIKEKEELEILEREETQYSSNDKFKNVNSTEYYDFKKKILKNITDRFDLYGLGLSEKGIGFIKHLPNLIRILSNLDFPDENGNINCKNCTNCFNCIDCDNCNNCKNCLICHNCEYCNNCLNCTECKNSDFCCKSSLCDTCKYCECCNFCSKCDSLDRGYQLKEINAYRRSYEEIMSSPEYWR